MADTRLDRELTTRDKTVRAPKWTKPELLPSPKPQDGYAFRWIRVAMQGQADPTNVSSKIREGWEPVKAVDHPEIFLMHAENDRFKDNIVMGGLMLCKAPLEIIEQRNEYYNQQADSQIHAVDNNLMKANDPRMPLFNDRKTKVTFGKG
jgi:hypothetical protein